MIFFQKTATLSSLIAGIICLMPNRSLGQQNITMERLRSQLVYKNYPVAVLDQLLEHVNKLSERPHFREDIPGEIVAWDIFADRFVFSQAYRVVGVQLIPIKVIPDDTAFLAQLNRAAPVGIRYIYDREAWAFGYVKEKRKDGSFLILNHAKSYSPYPEIPSDDIINVDMEYTTKDFEHFKLIRCKFEDDKEWKEMK